MCAWHNFGGSDPLALGRAALMPLPGRFLDEGGSADLAEIVEEELLDHLHLLFVEKREELLHFPRGLLEEGTVLVERAIGPVEENAEVGTRLHELRGEA